MTNELQSSISILSKKYTLENRSDLFQKIDFFLGQFRYVLRQMQQCPVSLNQVFADQIFENGMK